MMDFREAYVHTGKGYLPIFINESDGRQTWVYSQENAESIERAATEKHPTSKPVNLLPFSASLGLDESWIK